MTKARIGTKSPYYINVCIKLAFTNESTVISIDSKV